MVRVNKKPQHLVFCLHFPHQPSKQRKLAVESSKRPYQARVSGPKKCPIRDAKEDMPERHEALFAADLFTLRRTAVWDADSLLCP